jgi:uncharacterized protein (DUF433 family)
VEAAQYLGLPAATVRSWVKGRGYETQSGRREFRPVVIPADPEGTLSFRNLVEIQILRALRVTHGVKLETIRKAIEFMRRTLGMEHPLASAKMLTGGKELFVNFLEVLIRADDGQVMLKRVVDEHLERVEWKGEEPVRLYPFAARGKRSERTVVLDPHVRWGKPVLVGTAIPVHDIAERAEAGESISSIARDYGRTVAEIRSALSYAA